MRFGWSLWVSQSNSSRISCLSDGEGEEEEEEADVEIIAIALVLTITNTVAFSRCDKFSQASNLANSAFMGGSFARNLAGNMVGRLFR
jgi:hypothetical protein